MAIFKFDHAFSDGLGIVSLLLSLADNYSIELFPFNRKYPMYLKIWNLIFLPYYLIKVCIMQINLVVSPSILKSETQIKSQNSLISTIHSESFDQISKVAKKLKVSFNDLMLSIYSSSLTKMIKDNKLPDNENLKKFTISVPIGFREVPVSIKDLVITNNSPGMVLNLESISDSLLEGKKLSEYLNSTVKDLGVVQATNYILFIFSCFLPYRLMISIFVNVSKKCDFIFSNVPCTREALYYNGSKCEEMFPYITTGFFSTFFACLTYDKKMNFLFSQSDNLGVNPELCKKYFEIEYKRVIKSLE